jgi:nucleoside-diphosphate-sugar epimerase
LNRRMPQGLPEVDRVVPFTLGQEPGLDAFEGADALIHCAYDFQASTWDEIKRTNVDGSLALLAAAHAARVPTIIFISTLSAFSGCRSMYGRAKLAVEEAAARFGVISIRPGLVFDGDRPRGMVGALARVLDISPIVPLIGNGNQILYPCHIDDLGQLVFHLCTTRQQITKPITAAAKSGTTFKQILSGMAAARRQRRIFVPVPYWSALAVLRCAESLGVKTRLRSDSLTSLVNQNPHVDFSELDATGIAFRDFAFT